VKRRAAGRGTFARMRLVDAVSIRSRRRKLRLFLDEIRPTADTTVLDVGVDEVGFGSQGGQSGCATHNFFEEHYPWPARITALGLHDGAGFREHYPAIPYVQGDACALPFPDGAFDVVFSNAVIEHVGDAERQRLFVSEALRVGGRVFLTTPNRWFPVEVHTRLPLVHWLPRSGSSRAYDLAGKGFAKDNHLLGTGAFRALFPGPVKIVNLGLTLVAIA
jgi:SAM-dependent methyltransferase